ncbi:hypothetical protein CMUS01_16518, partial [Colletotrichum musicola]
MGLAFSRLFFAGLAAAAAVSTVLGVPIASPEPTLLDMPRWRWKVKGGGPSKRPTDKPALTPFSEDTSDGPAEPATLDARWDWGSTPKVDAPDTADAVEKRRWLKLLSAEEDASDAADAVDKRAESTLRGSAGRGRGRASADNYKKQARDAAVEVDEIWTLFSDSEKPGT